MKFSKGESLALLTTFRIGGTARFFCSVANKGELQEAVDFARENKLPVFILGGGSNILVSDAGFDGLVIKIEIMGIEEADAPVDEHKSTYTDRASDKGGHDHGAKDAVFVRAGAGENWDDLVAWTVERGFGGLENLSFIPGTVGAAPVQNVGAYGIEAGDMIESVEAFDFKLNEHRMFSRDECRFSYRDSIFKREKGRYAIASVLFTLKKGAEPDVSYKDLKEYFNNKSVEKFPSSECLVPSGDDRDSVLGTRDFRLPSPSIREVRDVVIAIRTAKLPDIRKVGTAGSFFKNPVVSKQKYEKLKETYPNLPSFPQADNRVKIPLAWIIDHVCGLKGKKFGKAGIHETQALVIVNYGGASFKDVEKAAAEIEKSVKEKTGIDIEREVVMV